MRSNPFARCEGVLGKDHLIGRASVLQDMAAWLQRDRNLSLYGMLHVGKSSVLHAAFVEQELALYSDNIVLIANNLPSLIEADEKPQQFFRVLVEQCIEELEDLGLASDIMRAAADKALQEGLSWSTCVSCTKRFFQRVCQAHLHVIFILEKFDHITKIFKDNIAAFSALQELCSNPVCRVRFITESLQPLKELVPNDPAISTFNKLFDHYCLGPFNTQDMSMYFKLLASTSIDDTHAFPLTPTLQEQIDHYCGGHPYLLVKLGYELAEFFLQTGQVKIEQAMQKVEETFIEYIFDLKSTLRREQIGALMQAITATKNMPGRDVLDALLAYGLIRPAPACLPSDDEAKPVYMTFLPDLCDYLQTSRRKIEDPHAWSQTMIPGIVIKEQYEIREQLGTTGHSQVAKAWDLRFKQYVALKRLYLDPTDSEEIIKSVRRGLEREAQILRGIKHANVGSVYDIMNDEDGTPTIVMEWIEGKPLNQTWEIGKGLSAIDVVRLGLKLAKALVYLHTKKQPVIHRDIKPENIIIQENGEPILIDFDVARAAGRVETIMPYGSQGNSASFAGSPLYSAPEQLINSKNVTDRADIYALGVVLCEALTGENKGSYWWFNLPLHQGSTLHSTLPEPLYQIICTMLSENPHARPDAQRLCTVLEQCLQILER